MRDTATIDGELGERTPSTALIDQLLDEWTAVAAAPLRRLLGSAVQPVRDSKVHRYGRPQRNEVAGGAMQLRYISVPALIAGVGGDPWAINQSLQAGRPAQITDLAESFHAAGRCTTDADATFEQARSRFDAAWNHQNGDHLINDSAEVQQVTKALGAQSVQLPKIGGDLETIAAALTEAQETAAGQIATLEGQLQQLDKIIGLAVEDEKDATSPQRPETNSTPSSQSATMTPSKTQKRL
jgi:hypothetical protein